MLAIAFSLPIIALTLVVGIFVPWLGLHLELRHRAQRRLDAERAHVIDQQRSTIDTDR